MKRRIACSLSTILLTTVSFAETQQAKRVPRVGYLSASAHVTHAPSFEAFRIGLRERGYVEGQNIVVEARFAEGKAERIPRLVAELAHLNVDLIVAGGNQAARPAKEVTKTIPIVVVHLEDPDN